MQYTYKFEKESCPYKNVCMHYNDNLRCNEACIRYMKMDYLMQKAMLKKKHRQNVALIPQDCDLDAFRELADIKQNIDDFVDSGKSLLIYSSTTGNGKTSWAVKMMLNYFNKIWHTTDFEPRALMIHVPTFFNMLKEDIRENKEYIEYIKEIINTVDLVIWDDIGVKSLTPYENDYLLSYISNRIDDGKANIYTSNLLEEDALEYLGDRLYSRIYNQSKRILLVGNDRREVK